MNVSVLRATFAERGFLNRSKGGLMRWVLNLTGAGGIFTGPRTLNRCTGVARRLSNLRGVVLTLTGPEFLGWAAAGLTRWLSNL